MNKLFTSIAAVSLGLTMAIGVGTAVGTSVSKEAKQVDAAAGWVEHTGTLTSGTEYLIVSLDESACMKPANTSSSGTSTTNTGGYSSVTFNASSGPDMGFVFESTGTSNQYYIKDGAVYVYASGTTNNGLGSKANGSGSNDSKWTVTETSSGSGEYSIISASSRQLSKYSSNWRSYGTTSGSKTNVKIFEKGGSTKTQTTTEITPSGGKTELDVTATPADSVLLTSKVSYSGGTISTSVSWASSNPSVATISTDSGTTTTVTAVAKGTTTITASYAGSDTYAASDATIKISVVDPSEKSYSLKFGDGIVDSEGWGTSYSEHNGYTKTETGIGTLTFNFAAASKQGSTITEYPVGKNGAVEMVLSSTNRYIKDVTFNAIQWGTKSQTMTINYSTDGGSTYTSTGVTSSSFVASATDLVVGTNAIKITFSNASNQIAHESFVVAFAEKPVLSSIESSGQKTSFDYADEFTYGGTLTAHYTAGKADKNVDPASFKYGESGINPETAGTLITIGTTLIDATHNGKYIYISYTEDGVTKWTNGYQITVSAAPSHFMTLSVSTDTGTDYGYKGGIVEVDVTSSSLAGNINWEVTSGSVSDAVYDNTSYMATITSVGTLTIKATDSGDVENTHSVTVTIVDSLNPVIADITTEYESSLVFTEAYGEGPATTDDDKTWTVSSDGTESVYDSTRGIHYGTGSAAVQYIKANSSSYSSLKITKIVVNASAASGVSATVGVKVGSKQFGGDPQSIGTAAEEYTFTGNETASSIEVEVTKPSSANKALYLKSIVVTYETSSGEVDISNKAGMHKAQQAVIDYANDFLDTLDDICVSYGSTDPDALSEAWGNLATQYDNWFNKGAKDLSTDEIDQAKNLFAYASDNKTGDVLQRMVDQYDWIVSHYGTLENFLHDDAGRDSLYDSTGRVAILADVNSSNIIPIIVIVSLISVSAIGGYFYIRRRKEHN